MGVRAALLIQHATHMRPIVTSFVALPSPPYFSTLSHKRHYFRKKIAEHKMCVLILSTARVRNISHKKNNSARYCNKCENIFMLSARYFCGILMKLECSRQSFEKVSNITFYQNPSTVVPCGQTDRRRTDGWTWRSWQSLFAILRPCIKKSAFSQAHGTRQNLS